MQYFRQKLIQLTLLLFEIPTLPDYIETLRRWSLTSLVFTYNIITIRHSPFTWVFMKGLNRHLFGNNILFISINLIVM